MSNRKKLSGREWILIIVSLVALQFSILSISQEYKSYSEVLGYLSFAGTITSIVLAVVAIIYSFVQGEANQRSSESVFWQVEKLAGASEKLVETGNYIEKQVARYEELENQLVELNENIRETKKSVVESKKERDSIRSSILELHSVFSNQSERRQSQSSDTENDEEAIGWVIENKLEYTTLTMEAAAYAAYSLLITNPESITTGEFIKEILLPSMTSVTFNNRNVDDEAEDSERKSEAFLYLNYGALHQCVNTLIALDAILVNDSDKIYLSKKFATSVQKLGNDVENPISDIYQAAKNEIDLRLDNFEK